MAGRLAFLVRWAGPEPLHPLVHVVYEPRPRPNVMHGGLEVETARLHEQGHLLGPPVEHVARQEAYHTTGVPRSAGQRLF
jgi:hypothetical protein